MNTSLHPICRIWPTATGGASQSVLLAFAVFAFSMSMIGCRSETATTTTTAVTTSDDNESTSEVGPVTIKITTPDLVNESTPTDAPPSFERSFNIATGTTLEDVMRKIEQPEIVITGSGVTAFVQSIDGVQTTSKRGWTFAIDGEFANEGIGSIELTPPQTIRWRFTTFEEAMSK